MKIVDRPTVLCFLEQNDPPYLKVDTKTFHLPSLPCLNAQALLSEAARVQTSLAPATPTHQNQSISENCNYLKVTG